MATKLRHGYHDAVINTVSYPHGEDIALDVILCGCCNSTPGAEARITFIGVHNFETARDAIDNLVAMNADTGRPTEIVGIVKERKRGWMLDLSELGPLIDCASICEA